MIKHSYNRYQIKFKVYKRFPESLFDQKTRDSKLYFNYMKNNNKSLPKAVSNHMLNYFQKTSHPFTFTCLKNMLKFVNKNW